MNSAASNIDKKSIQTLIDNLIQKDEIFNKKTTQGFDSLYKFQQQTYLPVDVDKPANVETPRKNINISSSKTTNNIFTETPAL